MTGVPAKCTQCGFSFQNRSLLADNARNITIIGDANVECPQCGGLARLVVGTMDFVDGGIELISGPQWSQDVIDALRLTLRRVVEEQPDDAIDQLEPVSKPLATALRKATGAGAVVTSSLCSPSSMQS